MDILKSGRISLLYWVIILPIRIGFLFGIYAHVISICTGGRKKVQYRDGNLLRAGEMQIFRKVSISNTMSPPVVCGKPDAGVANMLAEAANPLERSKHLLEWSGSCQISRTVGSNFTESARIKYLCSFGLTLDIWFFLNYGYPRGRCGAL